MTHLKGKPSIALRIWRSERLAGVVRFIALVAMAASILWMKLTRTLLGTLILLIVIWWSMPALTGVKPFTPAGLVLWVDAQDTATKAAVVTSLLTVLGFLIAFASTVKSWKLQRRTELRLAAGDELNLFFTRVAGDVGTVSLLTEDLAEAKASLTLLGTLPSWQLEHLVKRSREANDAIDRLRKANITIHSLKSKHQSVLVDQRFGIRAFEFSQKALDRVASALVFSTLATAKDEANAKALLNTIDSAPWVNFSAICKDAGPAIAAGGGGLWGAAVTDVLPVGWASWNSLRKTTKQLMQLGGDPRPQA